VTSLTDEDWDNVQEALVRGGLRACLDNILRAHRHPCHVIVSDRNRRIIEQAYDDGGGGGITLVPTNDCPWFAGMYGDSEQMLGREHDGTLFSITHLSGGGLVAVIVGDGIAVNDPGVVFRNVAEAKAYVKGLTAK
jgi:hypothetical protein